MSFKTTCFDISRSSFPYLFHTGGKIKKNEMGEACGMYGEEERCTQGFGREI
jgi:hypothetical protein